MPSRKLVMFGLLGVVTISVPAFAQQSGPSAQPYPPACSATSVSQANSEQAHAIYNAGRVAYDEGNYDGAIAQFRDAYRRDCAKHDLLIIISRSYELKGDKVEAVKALELYLERVKDPPDAVTHRTKIDNLKKQIAAQPPPPPPPTATSTSTASTTTQPPQEIREHTVAPWILVGVGGAAIVTGLIILVSAPGLPSNCNASTNTCVRAAGEPDSQYSDDQNKATNHENLPKIGLGVLIPGAAILAGGLIWHFAEPTGPVKKDALLTPVLAPGYAGLSAVGRF